MLCGNKVPIDNPAEGLCGARAGGPGGEAGAGCLGQDHQAPWVTCWGSTLSDPGSVCTEKQMAISSPVHTFLFVASHFISIVAVCSFCGYHLFHPGRTVSGFLLHKPLS